MNAKLVARTSPIAVRAACIFQKNYENLHRQNNEVRCTRVSQDNGKRPVLGGAEIAKRSATKARSPLQTLRADIDYGVAKS